MAQKLALLVLICLCSIAAFAQTQTEPSKPKTEEDPEKLRKEAVVFLRETLADVGSMRSLENRISFTAEMASLMWFYDEREARSMYTSVMGDYRDLLGRYDSQLNALGINPEDGDMETGFGSSFLTEPNDSARVLRKFTVALGVGQQIAMSLAEHDPDLAYSFYYDSMASIANPAVREKSASGGGYFEAQLLGRIAEKDAAKAAQLAAKSLGKDVIYQHVDLLMKIYGKDPDKGAEFGEALLSRLKSKKIEPDDFYVVKRLIQFGDTTLEASKKPDGKRPVYTNSELRELIELLAQGLLNKTDDLGRSGRYGESVTDYLDVIQKYSPGRAAQIKVKYGVKDSPNAASAMNTAANAAYPPDVLRTGAASNSNTSGADAEKKLFEDVKSLGNKQLPKEEREKIIVQARKVIMQTPGRDKKIMALSALATQVAQLGDKELAGEIMRDAEKLVNPAPKNYQDFLLSWMLATGYAKADPEKAFPILEQTISRANDTLSAFIKVGEFIDVTEEMIIDGEVQVGAFGGSMVRGLTSELGMADSTIQVLAKADFPKTKALANGFDRTEIRVLAKMMILRAVLSPKKDPTKVDVAVDPDMDTDK